jgi:hypothetical protein
MDIQEELFYAVINCNHPKIYNLIQQGANIHSFFPVTKFIQFYNYNVSTDVKSYTYLLILETYIYHAYYESKELLYQYGNKTTMSDWIMFDKSKLVKGLKASHYEDTFIFLLRCGASLHQIVPFHYDRSHYNVQNAIATFDHVIKNFLWSPTRLTNLLLKIFANVKVNFNAPSLERFRDKCFTTMEYDNYRYLNNGGDYVKEVLKVALLNGLTMPEFSRKYRKKWCRKHRYILYWNTFMLLYCFELKKVNVLLI